MATIEESVQEELLWIGTAQGQGGLKTAVDNRVNNPEKYLCKAERAALKEGYSLSVSWAVTDMPKPTKAVLAAAYEKRHDALPGFRQADGEWVKGVQIISKKTNQAEADLTWDTGPLDNNTLQRVPECHGIYCVRAVPRGKA